MPWKTWSVAEQMLASEFNAFIADQTVATFTNAASRTALLLDPKVGQLTTLDDHTGVIYQWDGTTWITHAPMRATAGHATPPTTAPGADLVAPFTQAGLSLQTTNAGGGITIVFPEAFASAPPVILLTDRTASEAGSYSFSVIEANVTASDFGGICRNLGGDAIVSSVVRFSWLAIGEKAL